MAALVEYCQRCDDTTRTALPPVWARRLGLVLTGCTLAVPVLAPFLASDPVVTIVSFLGLGTAAGPVAMILRSQGSCCDCHLDRRGSALRRLGVVRFLAATG